MGKSLDLHYSLSWIFYLLILVTFSGCEKFDPVENAPAFIQVDDFTFTTTNAQGDAAHRIEDVWVTRGTEFIGVFPIPSKIPILAEGNQSISIAAGIRLNGISSARLIYPFYKTHDITLDLVQDSVYTVVPEFRYSSSADFAFIEDFEDVGVQLVSTINSEADVERTDDPDNVFQGQSAKLTLQEAQLKFECKTNQKYILPGSGNSVILEFNYKSNNSLVVGTFVSIPGAIPGSFSVIQEALISLNPTDEWKRIYVSFVNQVSGNPDNLGIEPFFGFIRDESLEGDATVYLDNVKLVY